MHDKAEECLIILSMLYQLARFSGRNYYHIYDLTVLLILSVHPIRTDPACKILYLYSWHLEKITCSEYAFLVFKRKKNREYILSRGRNGCAAMDGFRLHLQYRNRQHWFQKFNLNLGHLVVMNINKLLRLEWNLLQIVRSKFAHVDSIYCIYIGFLTCIS